MGKKFLRDSYWQTSMKSHKVDVDMENIKLHCLEQYLLFFWCAVNMISF